MRSNVGAQALGCVCSLVISLPASAGDLLTYITDIRRCTAAYSGNGSATSTDQRRTPFERYEGAANLDVTNGLETWVAHSDQHSDMDGTSMHFSGSGDVLVAAAPLSSPLSSLGQTKFDVFFTVDTSIEYEVRGRLSRGGHAHSSARVVLSICGEEGNTVLERVDAASEFPQDFAWRGTLEPGMYRLQGEASARCETAPLELISTGEAFCAFEFTASGATACSSDWDADGDLDSGDIFAFIQDFFGPGADFDGDGETGSSDVFAFLDAFLRGC